MQRRYFMKRIIKVLAIVLCLAMFTSSVVPCVGTETVEAATKKLKVKLNCTKKTMYVGDTFKLKISGTKKKVKWSSSSNIVEISKNGVVKAKSLYLKDKDTCKVYATVGGNKYTCKITVKENKLNYTDITINEGDSIKLELIGTKSNVRWESSSPIPATISSDGVVTTLPNSGGFRVSITAHVDGIDDRVYSCKIYIKRNKSENKEVETETEI